MWFVHNEETYVSDVASAGAEPVRFDDFCGRWEEVIQEAGWRGGGVERRTEILGIFDDMDIP